MKKKISLIVFLLSNIISIAQTKILTVDFSTTNGNIKKLTSVNNGPVSVVDGTSEECYRKIGVEMVRTHDFHGPFDYYGYSTFYNLFTQQFDYSFQTHDPADYLWSTTDTKITEMITPGFKPFFRLGISFPSQGQPALTPIPKDQDGINFHTFAGICKRTAMHYTDMWDSGFNYDIPYWEVWNEPNNGASWTMDSIQAYYRMYKQVADSMKNFNPNIKVGGPGTAKSAFYSGGNYFTINPNYVSNFFQYCQTNNTPLDFYSFHTYDRKNPYHIKQLADTISHFLNVSGFNQTELIVSEMNINTSGFINTGKGCAHLASTLISASDSRITKLLWYRGVDLGPLCNSDINGQADLQLNGYAYQFFNELYDSTNIRLNSSGDEFVLDNINDSLNNLMLISGKSTDNTMVKILVSNYESSYNNIDLQVNNLPWIASDQIDISIQKLTDNGLETTNSNVSGANNLTVNLPNMIDATTYLVTLRKKSTSAISEINSNPFFTIFPNPSNSDFNIKFKEDLSNGEIIITNQLGETVQSYSKITGNELKITRENLKPGIYFVKLSNENKYSHVEKICISE